MKIMCEKFLKRIFFTFVEGRRTFLQYFQQFLIEADLLSILFASSIHFCSFYSLFFGVIIDIIPTTVSCYPVYLSVVLYLTILY